MNNEDKMREEFEIELMMEQFPHRSKEDILIIIQDWQESGGGYFERSAFSGEYFCEWTRWAWWGYRKSRAKLCVELPHESAIFWHQDVCEALDDAGVKYK